MNQFRRCLFWHAWSWKLRYPFNLSCKWTKNRNKQFNRKRVKSIFESGCHLVTVKMQVLKQCFTISSTQPPPPTPSIVNVNPTVYPVLCVGYISVFTPQILWWLNAYRYIFAHCIEKAISNNSLLKSKQLLLFAIALQYPSKHDWLSQCCFNAGPPSTTLAQH